MANMKYVALLVTLLWLIGCRTAVATPTLTSAPTKTLALPESSPTSSPSRTPEPPTATSTAQPTATNIPTPTITPFNTPTPTTRLITEAPLFAGGDILFAGWSPNGQYLSYFEYSEAQVASTVSKARGTYPGTFVIYDTHSGEKCLDYPLDASFPYEGGQSGPPWHWLPDGSLLIQAPDRLLERTLAPCVPGEPIAVASISSIETPGPDKQKLLMVSDGQYIIYDWMADTFVVIPEVEPTHMNNLVWSPDGQHISITLAGNYTGNRDPIGGTRVIDVATGEIIARYDWEPANALDGTFGGPVWINNEVFVVTMAVDQGPFLMTVNGDVTPVLPLFGETFTPENIWPPLGVYADIESDRYAILHQNGQTGKGQLLVVSPDMEQMEQLSSRVGDYQIIPEGLILFWDGSQRIWTRPVFETNTLFEKKPAAYSAWIQSENKFGCNN